MTSIKHYGFYSIRRAALSRGGYLQGAGWIPARAVALPPNRLGSVPPADPSPAVNTLGQP